MTNSFRGCLLRLRFPVARGATVWPFEHCRAWRKFFVFVFLLSTRRFWVLREQVFHRHNLLANYTPNWQTCVYMNRLLYADWETVATLLPCVVQPPPSRCFLTPWLIPFRRVPSCTIDGYTTNYHNTVFHSSTDKWARPVVPPINTIVPYSVLYQPIFKLPEQTMMFLQRISGVVSTIHRGDCVVTCRTQGMPEPYGVHYQCAYVCRCGIPACRVGETTVEWVIPVFPGQVFLTELAFPTGT